MFCIPTSSAASERSWSMHKIVHNNARNQLKPERVARLVFVYANTRVTKESDEYVEDSVMLALDFAPNLDDDTIDEAEFEEVIDDQADEIQIFPF